jgi:hypothetical protein
MGMKSKVLEATIQIDPEQDHFGFIKELSVRWNEKLIFACEEDTSRNREGVPDLSACLDLSPLNTIS